MVCRFFLHRLVLDDPDRCQAQSTGDWICHLRHDHERYGSDHYDADNREYWPGLLGPLISTAVTMTRRAPESPLSKIITDLRLMRAEHAEAIDTIDAAIDALLQVEGVGEPEAAHRDGSECAT